MSENVTKRPTQYLISITAILITLLITMSGCVAVESITRKITDFNQGSSEARDAIEDGKEELDAWRNLPKIASCD